MLLGALTVVPPTQRLLEVLTLPGGVTLEEGALEEEGAAVEKVAEDWMEEGLSTLACVCGVLEGTAACAEERLLWWPDSELLS